LFFQELTLSLSRFWADHGCVIQQGYDIEAGAGTFHPSTFLKVLGPRPWKAAYAAPTRRPTDGRYGENPNRLQQYYQYQVILKPAPSDIQNLYLESLTSLGIDPLKHDIRFVQDDWESPSIGAWGLGWEVRLDGMEITQFTYFQEIGGVPLEVIPAEITYGTERIAMYLQEVDNVFDLQWTKGVTYRDVHHQGEVQNSRYNFEKANVETLLKVFELYEKDAKGLAGEGLVIPAYDLCIKCSHLFNLLDARGALSVTERTHYIARIRHLSKRCAEGYLELEKSLAGEGSGKET
jgi:glycyl-tRNA synthetase alpha chain